MSFIEDQPILVQEATVLLSLPYLCKMKVSDILQITRSVILFIMSFDNLLFSSLFLFIFNSAGSLSQALHCQVWAFSNCGKSGLSGFQSVWHSSSVVAARGLSCPAACGI